MRRHSPLVIVAVRGQHLGRAFRRFARRRAPAPAARLPTISAQYSSARLPADLLIGVGFQKLYARPEEQIQKEQNRHRQMSQEFTGMAKKRRQKNLLTAEIDGIS